MQQNLVEFRSVIAEGYWKKVKKHVTAGKGRAFLFDGLMNKLK